MQLSKLRCQTFRDACCNVIVGGGWGKREEQLGGISITVLRESMQCDCRPSDLEYSENRSDPNTEP